MIVIVKYQDDYWLYHRQRNGELLMLKHLSIAGKTTEAAQKDVDIMKSQEQLATVLESLQEKR